jgi:hypothetical protein
MMARNVWGADSRTHWDRLDLATNVAGIGFDIYIADEQGATKVARREWCGGDVARECGRTYQRTVWVLPCYIGVRIDMSRRAARIR